MAKVSAKREIEMEIQREVGLLRAVYWQPPNDKYKPQPTSAIGSRLERLKELGLVKKNTHGRWFVTQKGVIIMNKSKGGAGRLGGGRGKARKVYGTKVTKEGNG